MSAQAGLFAQEESTLPKNVSLAARIEAFQTFPYRRQPYCRRNWGHKNHSICSYQGKLKPAIAHFLVSGFTNPGETVLDPFSGVGTIPFEACLQSRIGFGLDLNPMAYHNTVAKVRAVDPVKVWIAFDKLTQFVDSNSPSDVDFLSARLDNINGNLSDYYHQRTFHEILLARKFYQQSKNRGPEYSLVFSCLFHILHGNRPYALSRRSHPLTPFKPSGDFEYRSLRLKLRGKIQRVLLDRSSDSWREGRAYLASVFRLREVLDREQVSSVDTIITSPPFLDSTRFYIANWIRFWFSGWEPEDFRGPMRNEFLETLQSKDLTIYRNVFEQFFSVLKSGGLAILHLGVVGVKDMANSICVFAREAGFQIIDLIYEDVEGREKHGVRDQGITRKHQFLFLLKP